MVRVFNNGCLIKSASLINGEVIVQISNGAKSIYMFVLSPNGLASWESSLHHPGLDVLETVFQDVLKKFPQCM